MSSDREDRTYRLYLGVDVYVEKEEEQTWEDVEAEIESRYSFDVYNTEGDAYVVSVELDSFVEGV